MRGLLVLCLLVALSGVLSGCWERGEPRCGCAGSREAHVPRSGRLAEAREPRRRAGVLPRLAARSAHRQARRARQQHPLRVGRPQLPAELGLAGDGRWRRGRRAPRQPSRLPGRDEDPDVPHRRLRQPQRAVLRVARRSYLGERDQLAPSTRSTRTPTRGITCCSGGAPATCTRCPSTWRRRSPDSTCGST